MGVLAGLAGCAQPAQQATAPPAVSAAGAQPAVASTTPVAKPASCSFQQLGHSVRPNEDAQFVFSVKSDSQWCFDGFMLSGATTQTQSIAEPPAHGTLRLVHQPGAVIMGYRPAPAYVGGDRFRVEVDGSAGAVYFAGHVTVEP